MTTKPQPTTPYDAEIGNLESIDRLLTAEEATEFTRLTNLAFGYLRAKAEDADLLAAAEAVLLYPARDETQCLADISNASCTCRGHDALERLRAAIARAGGGTP